MSSSLENYGFVRDEIITNYAVLCVASYILGIGDRHLSNFLIKHSTGVSISINLSYYQEIISIHFGLALGSGINEFFPDLMPFRLTQIFEGLCHPEGINGIFREAMIEAMNCLRNNRHIIIDYCEIFIKDPLLVHILLARGNKIPQDLLQRKLEQLKIEDEIYSSSVPITISTELEQLRISQQHSQNQH